MADGVENDVRGRRACRSCGAGVVCVDRRHSAGHRDPVEKVRGCAVDREAGDAAARGVVRARDICEQRRHVDWRAAGLLVRRPPDDPEAGRRRVICAVERHQPHEARLVAEVRRHQERLAGGRRQRDRRHGDVVRAARCGDESRRAVLGLVCRYGDVSGHVCPFSSRWRRRTRAAS